MNCPFHQKSLVLHNQFLVHSMLGMGSRLGNLPLIRSIFSKLTAEEVKFHEESKFGNCLHLAIEYRHILLVRYFVKNLKWDPYHCDTQGNNAVYKAIHMGNLKIVKLFIEEYGCDPSRKDDNNYTPLHVASVAGHLDILKYFIKEKKCDPNSADSC